MKKNYLALVTLFCCFIGLAQEVIDIDFIEGGETICAGNSVILEFVLDAEPTGNNNYQVLDSEKDYLIYSGTSNIIDLGEVKESLLLELYQNADFIEELYINVGNSYAGEDKVVNICNNAEGIELFDFLSDADPGGIWQDPNGDTFDGIYDASIDEAGSYTYTVLSSNSSCPNDSSQIDIIIDFTNYAGEDISVNICSDAENIELFDFLSDADLGGIWHDPNGNIFDGIYNASIDESGSYTYTVSSISGSCPSDSSQIDIIIDFTNYAGEDISVNICSDAENIELFDFLSGADPGGIWQDPNGNTFDGIYDASIDETGSYVYTVQSINNCPNDTALVEVTEDDTLSCLPIIPPEELSYTFLQGSLNNCFGNSVEIQFEVYPEGEYNYSISYGINHEFNSFQNSFSYVTDELFVDTSILVYVSNSEGVIQETIEITTEHVDPGRNTQISFCNVDVNYNLFDYLGGVPDEGGFWTDSNGNSLEDGIFNPSVEASGIYKYFPSISCTDVFSKLTISVDNSVNCNYKTETDLDGDGVENEADLDDDNDGILDEDENLACVDAFEPTESRVLFYENFGEGGPVRDKNVSNDLTFTTGVPQDVYLNDGEYSVATSTYLFEAEGWQSTFVATDLNGHLDGDGTLEGRFLCVNMLTSSFVNESIYEKSDIPVVKGKTNILEVKLTNLEYGVLPPRVKIQILSENQSIIGEIESYDSDLLNSIDVWNDFVISFIPDSSVEKVTLRIVNTQNQSGIGNDLGIDNISLKTLECNVDNDELPNYLDVDSDGDGVFDTIEAGLDPSLDANNDGIVDGDVDQNGVPLAVNGGLEVVDENENGVPDYLDNEDVTLSIEINNLKKSIYNIYPNPAEDFITIPAKNKEELKNISLFDFTGKVVLKNLNYDKIDVTNLKSGVYFLKIEDMNSNSYTKKIIKK